MFWYLRMNEASKLVNNSCCVWCWSDEHGWMRHTWVAFFTLLLLQARTVGQQSISGSLLQFHRFSADFAAELDGHTAARFTTDADMVITLLHLTGIRQFATFLRRSALQYYRYFGQRSSQIIMTWIVLRIQGRSRITSLVAKHSVSSKEGNAPNTCIPDVDYDLMSTRRLCNVSRQFQWVEHCI